MTTKQPFSLQGVHHIAVQARDWEVSLKLYRDVLGLPIVSWIPAERKIALLALGDGSCIELFEPEKGTPALGAPAVNDPLTHIALRVDDVQAAIDHVRSAGYEVTLEPLDIRSDDGFEATIAFFNGPSGESIEFFKSAVV